MLYLILILNNLPNHIIYNYSNNMLLCNDNICFLGNNTQ